MKINIIINTRIKFKLNILKSDTTNQKIRPPRKKKKPIITIQPIQSIWIVKFYKWIQLNTQQWIQELLCYMAKNSQIQQFGSRPIIAMIIYQKLNTKCFSGRRGNKWRKKNVNCKYIAWTCHNDDKEWRGIFFYFGFFYSSFIE